MRSAGRVSLGARAVIVLAGVGLTLVPSPLHVVPVVLTLLAAAAAAVRPERVGALVPTVAFGIGWLAAGGWDASPDPVRTVVAAALLYVLHQATSFASLLPLGASVSSGVVRRWVVRSVPGVVVAAVVIAVTLAVPRRAGSPVVEVAALVGVLVVVGLTVRPVFASAPTDNAREG